MPFSQCYALVCNWNQVRIREQLLEAISKIEKKASAGVTKIPAQRLHFFQTKPQVDVKFENSSFSVLTV